MPLLEYRGAAPKRTSAAANPKSSTGRLDVFARVITDHGTEFDRIREGYKGPLYAEISPRAFSILVRTGSRLVQLRIRRGSPGFSDTALRRLHEEVGLVDAPTDGREPETIRNGLAFHRRCRRRQRDRHCRLQGAAPYRCDRCRPQLPLRPARLLGAGLPACAGEGIVLDPNDFYILASREAVVVPPDHAAEMLPYDTFVGEFRVHYAGFFDPGFGAAETGGAGSRAVLEVRSHEVPFLIEHGQIVGRLVYERLIARPDKLYGAPIGSSYQRQGLALSKHFRRSCRVNRRPPSAADAGRGGAAANRGQSGCGRFRSRRLRAGLDLGERLDDDADVFVLFRQAVHAGGGVESTRPQNRKTLSSEPPDEGR